MRIATAGVVLIVIGLAIFGFTLVQLVRGDALDPQTKVPGTITARIDAPGRYYVWDNHRTVFEGDRIQYAADCPDDVNVKVRDGNGAELEFVRDASESWSIGNNEKSSIGYVDVSRPTTVHLEINNAGRDRIVTVSNRTMKQELWARLGGFGVGIGVSAIGVPFCLIGLLVGGRKSPEVPMPLGTGSNPH